MQPTERTRFIDHRGTRVLHFDYRGVRDPEEALAAIRHSMTEARKHPPKSLRIMTSVRDARYNTAVLQALKELASVNEPYVKASAVVGMGGLHRIAYQAVILFSRRVLKTFDTEEEALDWLVQQP